ALAAFHDQTSTEANPTARILSDSEDSHTSDKEEVTRKRYWKGDSASTGKGNAPAKSLKLSLTLPLHNTLDPLEGSTTNAGNVMDDYYLNCSDVDLLANALRDSSSEFVKETFINMRPVTDLDS
ncbi:Hypothetical predicted protein, partial [Pelobates cultripes]